MLIRTEKGVVCDTKHDWGYQDDHEFATCMFAEKKYYQNLSGLLRETVEKLLAQEGQPLDGSEKQAIQDLLNQTKRRPLVI